MSESTPVIEPSPAVDTKVFRFKGEEVPGDALHACLEAIGRGGLVVIPTDTVYGLACNPFDSSAVRRIYELKGRSYKKPLPILLGQEAQLPLITEEILPEARRLMKLFWPGALTLVFKTGPLAVHAAHGRNTIAARIPDHGAIRLLLEQLNLPVAATSANDSGKPSLTSGTEAEKVFSGKVDVILDGGDCRWNKESSVVDASHFPFTVLREGAVTKAQLEEAVLGA